MSNASNEGTQQFDEPFHAHLGTVTPITRLDQLVKKNAVLGYTTLMGFFNP